MNSPPTQQEPVGPPTAQPDAFVRAVRDGERPYVDGEDGLWAVVMATSLLQSAALIRPIDLGDLPTRLQSV